MSSVPWVDWELAERVGVNLVPPGPVLTSSERNQLIADLRGSARRAPALVAEAAGLDPGPDNVPELVVDRAGIVRANIQIARITTDRLGELTTRPDALRRLVGGLRGAGVGAVLAIVGARILGQFDAYGSPRLLLVAPTIAQVERILDVDPADFRMWVCLHEQTHRVQFATATWLPEHMLGLMASVVDAGDEPGSLLDRLGNRLDAVRRDQRESRPLSTRMVDAVSAPATVATLDQLTAIMSLLEGHADVMMDRAAPGVIATLPTIRARFDARRGRGGPLAVIGRLLGMDAKLAQYREGAAFCRRVLQEAGPAGLNRAFTSPDALPTLPEILHPEQWMARVPSTDAPVGD